MTELTVGGAVSRGLLPRVVGVEAEASSFVSSVVSSVSLFVLLSSWSPVLISGVWSLPVLVRFSLLLVLLLVCVIELLMVLLSVLLIVLFIG